MGETGTTLPLGDEVEQWLRYLNHEQVAVLLEPIKEHRVGRDKKGLSHVEAYEIRAHLNRIFGFCRWSAECLAMELLGERESTVTKDGKTRDVVTVAYRAQMRLTIHSPGGVLLAVYTEWAAGDAPNFPVTQWPDAHDFAMKTAESQAFKRCAVNLGDQFGLSLYRKGSVAALVGVTLVPGVGPEGAASHDIQDHAPPTHRQPDPEPVRTQGEAEDVLPEPSPRLQARVEREQGTPANPAPPRQTADEYRSALLAAKDRKTLVTLLRVLSMDGLADEETADEQGSATTLAALASARMKEVER